MREVETETLFFWAFRVMTTDSTVVSINKPWWTDNATAPTDIVHAIDSLIEKGKLTARHCDVLRKYGLKRHAPHKYNPSEKNDCVVWEQAIDAMMGEFNRQGFQTKGK